MKRAACVTLLAALLLVPQVAAKGASVERGRDDDEGEREEHRRPQHHATGERRREPGEALDTARDRTQTPKPRNPIATVRALELQQQVPSGQRGSAKTIANDVARIAQQKSGMRLIDIPGVVMNRRSS